MEQNLLDAIYDAPFTENGWSSAFLKIADRFGATDAALYASCSKGLTLQSAVSGRLPDPIHKTYFDEFMIHDTQIVRLLQLENDQDITGLDLMEDQTVSPCRVHNEYLIPNEISSQIVWLLHGPDHRKYTFTLMRAETKGAFDASTRRAFGEVSKHVRRVIRLGTRLSAARIDDDARDSLFTHNQIAVFSTCENGEILSRNRFADHLLEHCRPLHDAIAEGARDARGQYWETSNRPIIRRYIFDAKDNAMYELTTHRPSRTSSIVLASCEKAQTLCMVRQVPITDDHKRVVWKTKFGLTEAELDLAMYVYRGRSLAECAEDRGRSIHTVRNQMKSLLSKTQCQRQSQLTRFLHRVTTE